MTREHPYEVRIARRSGKASRAEAGIRKAIVAVLRRHRAGRARISVALVDDAVTARLNRDFLGHQGPTDVLSFDLRDAENGQFVIDGEIVISVEMATKRARDRGHTVTAELALYAVHGTLHLLGYDDRSKAGATRMHAMEDDILTSIGFGSVYAKSTDGNAEL